MSTAVEPKGSGMRKSRFWMGYQRTATYGVAAAINGVWMVGTGSALAETPVATAPVSVNVTYADVIHAEAQPTMAVSAVPMAANTPRPVSAHDILDPVSLLDALSPLPVSIDVSMASEEVATTVELDAAQILVDGPRVEYSPGGVTFPGSVTLADSAVADPTAPFVFVPETASVLSDPMAPVVEPGANRLSPPIDDRLAPLPLPGEFVAVDEEPAPSATRAASPDTAGPSVADSPASGLSPTSTAAPLQAGGPLTPPSLNLQGAIIQIGDDFSARARLRGYYYLSSNVLAGATVDLTTGEAFSDTDSTGLSINELYLAASPSGTPNLRFVVGQLDLTSYFDRNSFAKDSLTHFFNPVFQTNPALAATQIQSQPAALVSWRAMDNLTLKATTFSSGGIEDFSIDGFAGEVGVRFGDLILRGTYASATDAGERTSFPEIFQTDRGNGIFGTLPGDREVAYGVNAEWYVPALNLGLFGRYGYHENQALDLSAETYSGGLNLFDVFMADDRLGVGYGWGLSNDSLREDQDGDTPDVFEVFYDVRLAPNIRVAVDWQQRNGFSETYIGVRVRADVELLNP
ncbi:MAG: carbohydrate porin [Cyanobacteria bacterium P01_D01_bin.14]